MSTKRRAPYRDTVNDLWLASVYLGRDPQTGKKIEKKVSSKTYEGCLEKLEELERKVSTGHVIAVAKKDRVTVDRWVESCLEREKGKLGPNTYTTYLSASRHIRTRLANVQVEKVTALHVDRLFTQLEDDGVGRRTQQKVYLLLNKYMKRAEALELIGHNPLRKVPRPSLDRSKKLAKPVWTVEHVRAFLAAASTHDLAALFVLAVATGMRQSELFGLRWECVDLDRAFLRVEYSLHEVPLAIAGEIDPKVGHSGLMLLPPKTESSRRSIALPVLALEALKAHKEKTKHLGTAFVFTGAEGAPLRSQNFTKRIWTPLLDGAQVPALPFKQLRHTCLTLLAEAGVSVKAAQALAGHQTSALTAEVYQQATQRLARQAADAMDRLLGS